MKNIKPRVSVIMPVHRVDLFLDQSINSILNQTFRDFELILILNGLSCNDINYIKENFLDNRIIIVNSNFNKIFHCLNLGLDIASSDYIVRMDSDDIAYPARLEVQVNFMDNNEKIGICGSFYNLIDEKSNIINSKFKKLITEDREIRKSLQYNTTIAHPTVIARKSALLQCAGYSNVDYIEDWDLWLRAARKKIKFSIIPFELLSYRIHSNQITSAKYNSEKLAVISTILLREFIFTANVNFILSIVYNAFLYAGINIKRLIIK